MSAALDFSKLKQRLRIPNSSWVDGVVIAVPLAGANLMLGAGDPGWLKSNPNPFLFLPLLMGARYGFGAGCIWGIVASAIIAAIQIGPAGLPLAEFFSVHSYLVGAFVVVGAVSGEIQDNARIKELRVSTLLESAQGRLKRLDTDLYLLREAKSELERILATRDSELSTLDSDLRRLSDSSDQDIHQNLLLLLNRQARVSEGAVYLVGENGKLTRKGLIGGETHLPAELEPDSIEMVELAMANKTTVTIPEFWKKGNYTIKNHLVCIPLINSESEVQGVFLATNIPFIALNRRSVQLMVLICRWASRVLEVRLASVGRFRVIKGLESQKIYELAYFKKSLELAFDSFRQHSVPSTVVVLGLPSEPALVQPQFEELIMASIRGGDFPADVGLAFPHLVVLLPLTGERGAKIFVQRIAANYTRSGKFSKPLEVKLLEFDSFPSAEALWIQITQNNAKGFSPA